MKKLSTLVITFLFFITVTLPVFAVTPTPTVKPTQSPTNVQKDESLTQQIEAIKDKIASTVAKLKLVDNRGLIGTVTETATTQLSVTDLQGNIRFVDVDQITKFSSPSSKSTTNFGISDLTKGTIISVIGKYNKDNKRMLARFIDVLSLPQYISGIITDVDKVNGVMKVMSEGNKEKTVDIETVSKTYSYDESASETKSGFSKAELGERVFVVGFTNAKDKNRISATRVLLFPTLPNNPHITVNVIRSPQVSPTETQTTAPIKRATPTP